MSLRGKLGCFLRTNQYFDIFFPTQKSHLRWLQNCITFTRSIPTQVPYEKSRKQHTAGFERHTGKQVVGGPESTLPALLWYVRVSETVPTLIMNNSTLLTFFIFKLFTGLPPKIRFSPCQTRSMGIRGKRGVALYHHDVTKAGDVPSANTKSVICWTGVTFT